jgi:hypothetical protein
MAMTGLVVAQAGGRRRERRALIRHFVEMVLAMLAGMFVLGALVQMVCAVLGHPGLFTHHVGLRAPLMAFNMAVGMALWMRHRGHDFAAIGEMTGAMFIPLAVLIGPYLAGLLSPGALLGLEHALMLPCMAAAMLRRRDDYVGHRP